jgi:alpha-N-arabinofuranosidase
MQLLALARGTSMQVRVDSETFDLPGYAIDDTSQYTGKEGVPFIDCASAWDKESGKLTVFIINRHETENFPVTLDLRGFEKRDEAETGASAFTAYSQTEIASEDISFVTEPEHDDLFAPKEVKEGTMKDGVFETHVKPLSWNVITFSL